MKTQILKIATFALLLSTSLNLWAGVDKFDSSEFNSIINDNLKAEKNLNNELQANTGIPDMEKEINTPANSKGRELVGVVEAEELVSPTTDHRLAKKDRSDKVLQQKSFKRVSQEINSSENE